MNLIFAEYMKSEQDYCRSVTSIDSACAPESIFYAVSDSAEEINYHVYETSYSSMDFESYKAIYVDEELESAVQTSLAVLAALDDGEY
jgi:hypothetical protein